MTHVSRAVANIGSLIGGIVAPNQSEEGKDRETDTVESVVPSEDDNVLSLTVSVNVTLLTKLVSFFTSLLQ